MMFTKSYKMKWNTHSSVQLVAGDAVIHKIKNKGIAFQKQKQEGKV